MSDDGQWDDAMHGVAQHEIAGLRERISGLEKRLAMFGDVERLAARIVAIEEEAPQPTLRDRFAMACLTASALYSVPDKVQERARYCYEVADAMLLAREGK